jgi:DnaJ family protein B protein 4
VIKIRDIIHPKYEYRIHGAGMPKSKKPGEFGDMVVKFDIRFPEHMTSENRKKLKEIVEQSM